MASFHKLLLCYDSTREGRKALIQGADLAQALGAETHLLSVSAAFTGAGMVMPTGFGMSEEERKIKEILCEGIERLRARGLKATGYIAYGNPIEQIPHMARKLQVDLVVLGHRRRGPLARWWMGAGNALLLDVLDCSILVSMEPDEG